MLDYPNARAAVCGVQPPMTVPKGFELFDLMAWLISACLAVVAIVCTADLVLVVVLRIQALLEGPCG